jgi:hypothetical protein
MKKYVYEITTSSPMQAEMFYKNLSYDNEMHIRHVTKIRALIDKERRAKSGNKQSTPCQHMFSHVDTYYVKCDLCGEKYPIV